jgi:hypothetical protein
MAWEISHMTTIVKADKNRLTVRGVQNGQSYLVKTEGPGWWIEPATTTRRRVREITHATRNLSEHFEALAADGFEFTPERKENVPPCRF